LLTSRFPLSSNIGNDAKALWEAYDGNVSEDFLVLRQQMHVSILSVCSFLGRLSSGMSPPSTTPFPSNPQILNHTTPTGVGSDWLAKKLDANRVWCLVLATLVFTLAQICALTITNPHFLVFVSGLSGLGYGFLFGVFPSIVAESFGIRGLSQNWGFLTLAPVVSSYVFNLLYGSTYDAHSVVKQPGGHLVCLQGIECYRTAYVVTLGACGLGIVAALWIIRRQYVQRLREESKGDLEN
jgi:MFS family permease